MPLDTLTELLQDLTDQDTQSHARIEGLQRTLTHEQLLLCLVQATAAQADRQARELQERSYELSSYCETFLETVPPVFLGKLLALSALQFTAARTCHRAQQKVQQRQEAIMQLKTSVEAEHAQQQQLQGQLREIAQHMARVQRQGEGGG